MMEVYIVKKPVHCFYMIGNPVMNKLTKKVQFAIKYFVAADKLKTFKLLNKNTISPKRIMFLCCVVNFESNFSTLI